MDQAVLPTATFAKPLRRKTNEWTLREHEVVISHWPDIATIMQILPHRSVHAIRTFAGKCNLRKPVHSWTQREHSVLKKRVSEGVNSRAIAEELGLSKEQVVARMRYTKMRYPRRLPRSSGNDVMDAIMLRLHQLNMSRRDLDQLCKTGNCFFQWSPARRIDPRHVWKAVNLLEGKFRVDWSDLGDEAPPLQRLQ
jgi:DNA-binding CsgD family transcriptional regulator